jgi:glycosyltransferase involved in cell wall biosynthesis
MSKSPRISVIVPAYNEEKSLAECLLSLTHQKTHFPYEIIVVDNRSTDRTAAIAKRYHVRVISEPRRGRPYARNAGLKAAHSPILAFTEADCIAPPRWIQTIGDFFGAHPEAAGVTGGLRFAKQDSLSTIVGPYSIRLGNAFYRLTLRNLTFRGTSFALPKQIADKAGTFSSHATPLDDLEYGFRAGKFGPIYFREELSITTGDRRFRGRLIPYIGEYLNSYIRLFVLRQSGRDAWYRDIRP